MQKEEEYTIFLAFSKHLGYPVSNIENRDPPEPDISCQMQNGDKVAFELTEIVDQGMARSTNINFSFKGLFRKHYDAYPEQTRSKLNSILGNAYVFIKFRDGVSLLKCQRIVPEFIDYLGSFSPSQSGEFILDDSNKLSEVIAKFKISRGQFTGPLWAIQASTRFSYPIDETLSEKFSKSYKTDALSIQLVAYFHLQPKPIPDWIDGIKTFIEAKIEHTPFSTVWVYLYNSDKVFLKVSRRQ